MSESIRFANGFSARRKTRKTAGVYREVHDCRDRVLQQSRKFISEAYDRALADKTFDVLIIGGGLIGTTLACALKDKSLRVGIIEANPIVFSIASKFESALNKEKSDLRSIALSHVSQRIFQALDLWGELQEGITPIKKIHISDRGRFGLTHLQAAEFNFSAFGYVVKLTKLQELLYRQLQKAQNITLFSPVQVLGIDFEPHSVTVTVADEGKQKRLESKLLVAADGGSSSTRQQLNIQTQVFDYQQMAIVTTLKLKRFHDDTAYERFIKNGSIALLPINTHEGVVILALPNEEAKNIFAWSDASFLDYLQKQFGYRAGKFLSVGARQTFSLQYVYAKEQVRHRFALVGNACHTLHPIAAQGFNLGLRDVAWLAQKISQIHLEGGDVGDFKHLIQYQASRYQDQIWLLNFTHQLVRFFTHELPPFAIARNLGLVGLEHCFPIKQKFARYMMGFVGTLPNLGVGVSSCDNTSLR